MRLFSTYFPILFIERHLQYVFISIKFKYTLTEYERQVKKLHRLIVLS